MVYILAESGGTRSTWTLVSNGCVKGQVALVGVQPYHNLNATTLNLIKEDLQPFIKKKPEHLFYYGAGVNEAKTKLRVHQFLKSIFGQIQIEVNTDILGSARALARGKTMAIGILGTGSNACLTDGHHIISQTTSLGYVLGDEGSGSWMGKKIITDYYYNKMPNQARPHFEQHHPELKQLGNLLELIYTKNAPNRYLASFAKTLALLQHTYKNTIACEGFDLFFKLHLSDFAKKTGNMVCFSGSIAHFFNDSLKRTLFLHATDVVATQKEATEGLLEYHNKHH